MDAEIISLGFDQSWKATGIALVRWHPVRGPHVLELRLVQPLKHPSLAVILASISQGHTPACVGIEAGFIYHDKPHAGIQIARACGVVETHIWYSFGDVPIYLMQATEWRPIVLGGGRYDKADIIVWGRTVAGDPELSEHIAEAIGIASAAASKHYNERR